MVFGIINIWTYVIGAFLIVLLPGPNSLFVLSTAARSGIGQGYRAALGVFVGDSVLMLLSAVGVASLLTSHPLLFSVVKYSGAAYLSWIGFGLLRLAWASWRSPDRMTPESTTVEPHTVPAETPDHHRPFRRALAISLLNPKAILFFVAFFVQFVDPSYSTPALSFLVLALILHLFSIAYLTVLIFGGTFLARHFRRRHKLSAGLSSAVGALFLSFGAKLATATLG